MNTRICDIEQYCILYQSSSAFVAYFSFLPKRKKKLTNKKQVGSFYPQFGQAHLLYWVHGLNFFTDSSI